MPDGELALIRRIVELATQFGRYGYQYTRAPNPLYCSAPTVLCPACAARVLGAGVGRHYDPAAATARARSGLTGNARRGGYDDEPLGLPTGNWADASAFDPARADPGRFTANAGDAPAAADPDGPLKLPTFDWAAWAGFRPDRGR